MLTNITSRLRKKAEDPGLMGESYSVLLCSLSSRNDTYSGEYIGHRAHQQEETLCLHAILLAIILRLPQRRVMKEWYWQACMACISTMRALSEEGLR